MGSTRTARAARAARTATKGIFREPIVVERMNCLRINCLLRSMGMELISADSAFQLPDFALVFLDLH